jgi:hypothetical protein
MVKCADCGYLGVREIESNRFVNPSTTQRRGGQPPPNFNGNAITRTEPNCVLGACDLECELSGPGTAPAANVMSKERLCEHFTDVIPGLSPKEHIDMNVLKQQEEFHRKCLEDDRRWRESQETARSQREDKRDRRQAWALWIAGIALFAGPVLTFVLARITR